MKLIFSTLLLSIFVLFSTTTSDAATLDTIGASATTNGTPGTEWWYSGENPTFTGTAAPNATVIVTISGAPTSVTADASGNWSFSPTTLTTGDHVISITEGSQTFTFTLHAGQNLPTGTTTTATDSGTLPVSGAIENTLLVLSLGGLFVISGWKLSKKLA